MFAGITLRPSQPQPELPQPRSPFAGIKAGLEQTAMPTPLERAVERVARAVVDIRKLRGQGYEPLPHQKIARDDAIKGLAAVHPDAPRDLGRAFEAHPELIDEPAKGRTAATIRAMQFEADLRAEAGQRADRFVTEWRQQVERYRGFQKAGDHDAADHARSRMAGMAKSLERDPQLESLLRNRRIDLGLKPESGGGLSHDLQDYLGLSRERGIGR
jgi:hypothetical protein